jgi:endonuclease/exonuclease/phosphatase family metal-dependent hydrolase
MKNNLKRFLNKFLILSFLFCLVLPSIGEPLEDIEIPLQEEETLRDELQNEVTPQSKLDFLKLSDMQIILKIRDLRPYEKRLKNILYSYEIHQPTKKFDLNPSFRTASLNINRGYSLENLKMIFGIDEAFQAIIDEYPEIERTETYKEATQAISKAAYSRKISASKRITEFDKKLAALINKENSNFAKIFPVKKITGVKKKYHFNFYAGIYELAKEMHHLASSDVIALQEVDYGMPRTNYANVVKELAEAHGYGYVWAPEFIEFYDDGKDYKSLKNFNHKDFKGMHGNAVLSKWPIQSARVVRFKESFTEDPNMHAMHQRRCYDWWKEELPQKGPFEGFIYTAGHVIFKEDAITPSVRLGSRMALLVDVQTPKGIVTVASTHLENRGNPKCRRAELNDLMGVIKDAKNPVVIAGDFNTTNEEARRPYFRHAVYWYVKNQFELSTLVANIANGLGLFFLGIPFPIPTGIPAIVQLANQTREWHNPTALGSSERKFFKETIEKFNFSDGTIIDTRGTKDFNQRHTDRRLANSNQSTAVGYKPTYCFHRNYAGVFCMKLDWILVKSKLTPQMKVSRRKDFINNAWAPTNPRTLFDSVVLANLSDHAAITTDLILPVE